MSSTRRQFYRILPSRFPTVTDFLSFEALGREPRTPLTPEAEERWRGISVFDTFENATAHVGRSAFLGRYAAVMEIGPEQQVVAKRTGGTRGHWTLWGSADELLSCVTAIIDISTEQEGT